MRFHTQTAGVSLTAQQPEVNIVRTALEALAAVLGGTQSLHTNSFDEALALPTENAVRIALRTQQVIAHETGVVNTIDPLGGSWYVEDLTNRLEAEAYEYFDRIRALGGVIPAIEENFFQREIADASFRYQAEVEAKQRVIVGVNRYQQRGGRGARAPADRPGAREEADRAGHALRARRDSAKVEETLAALSSSGAEGDENLMPLIVDASRAYVTMGEMCDTSATSGASGARRRSSSPAGARVRGRSHEFVLAQWRSGQSPLATGVSEGPSLRLSAARRRAARCGESRRLSPKQTGREDLTTPQRAPNRAARNRV